MEDNSSSFDFWLETAGWGLVVVLALWLLKKIFTPEEPVNYVPVEVKPPPEVDHFHITQLNSKKMDTSNTIRKCIKFLVEGHILSSTQIEECIQEIMTGQATPSQIGAFLVSLKVDTLTPETLYAVSQKMVSLALEFPISGEVILDVVGTGGDSLDTFNVSTATAITLASLGVKVAKQGNRSQSGRIGSSDFIEALGINLNLDNNQLLPIIEQYGFGYLFVQKFHPAMKYAGPVRKEIGVRTIFNVLGPLVNPACPTHMLVGVSLPKLGPLYAKVLSLNPRIKKAMVVHSVNGMDEIALDCDTKVWFVNGEEITEFTVSPEDFGLDRRPIEAVIGGKDAKENAQIFLDILSGKNSVVAFADWLCLNCSCALVLCDKAKDYKEGVQITRKAISDGTIRIFLEKYIELTNKV